MKTLGGSNVIDIEETYAVRLTQREMAALARLCAAYFQRATQAKLEVPVEIAAHVTQALYKMKDAVENKPALITEL